MACRPNFISRSSCAFLPDYRHLFHLGISTLSKSLHYLAAFIFLLFAILQWNDLDATLWAASYALCAIVAAYAAFEGKFKPILWALSLMLCVGLSIGGAPALWEFIASNQLDQLSKPMNPDHPSIEEARETIGMVICIAYLLLNYPLTRKSA